VGAGAEGVVGASNPGGEGMPPEVTVSGSPSGSVASGGMPVAGLNAVAEDGGRTVADSFSRLNNLPRNPGFSGCVMSGMATAAGALDGTAPGAIPSAAGDESTIPLGYSDGGGAGISANEGFPSCDFDFFHFKRSNNPGLRGVVVDSLGTLGADSARPVCASNSGT